MPNYIVNTAQFNPIDFATRIKPMEEYAKNFNAQQDAIDAISLEGDSISSLITNNDEDKGLRDLYSSFDNSVGEAVSNMLSTGDISAGRRAIANLSRFYKKNLEPIKTAAAARSKAISDYEAIKQKDRSYLGTNPNQFGVSSYLNGATPSIYGVSGKDLYAMANADAVAASSRESNIEDYKLSKGLLEQYFVRGKEQGFNNQQIGNLLLGDVLNYKALSEKEKNSLPIERRKAMDYISSAYDRVASAYDINSLNTVDADGNIGITNDYTQAGTFILNGLYSGMTYKYDEDHLTNQGYMDAYKTEQARRLKLENDAAEAALTGIDSVPEAPYDTIDYVSVTGIDSAKYQEALSFLENVDSDPSILGKTAIPAGSRVVGTSNTGYTQTVSTPAKTYGDLLKDIAAEHNLPISITHNTTENDPNGKNKDEWVISGSKEAKEALRKVLNATVELSTGKRLKNADGNDRAISHINGRLVASSGSSLVTDENGKDITEKKGQKYQAPKGSQIIFTPDGNFAIRQPDNKTIVLDPEVISGDSQSNVYIPGNEPIPLRDAISSYKRAYQTLQSKKTELSPEVYSNTAKYLGILSDAIMRAIDSEANSYPKVQSTTDSKLE